MTTPVYISYDDTADLFSARTDRPHGGSIGVGPTPIAALVNLGRLYEDKRKAPPAPFPPSTVRLFHRFARLDYTPGSKTLTQAMLDLLAECPPLVSTHVKPEDLKVLVDWHEDVKGHEGRMIVRGTYLLGSAVKKFQFDVSLDGITPTHTLVWAKRLHEAALNCQPQDAK
jgi:hypothetical protein